MNDRPGPYARLLAHGRLAALVALSVVAGGVGGAWAVAGAPGLDRATVMTVSADADDPATQKSAEPQKSKAPKPSKSGRPSDAGRPSGAGKPSKAPKAAGSGASATGAKGVHGRCVSKVATSDATGGPNDNHGGAVSAAAESCPHPTPAASATD